MRFRKPTVESLEINLTPVIDGLLFLIAADANAVQQSVVRVINLAGKLVFLNINV